MRDRSKVLSTLSLEAATLSLGRKFTKIGEAGAYHEHDKRIQSKFTRHVCGQLGTAQCNLGSELVGSGVAGGTWHCIRADRVFLSGTNDVVVRARFRHLRTC